MDYIDATVIGALATILSVIAAFTLVFGCGIPAISRTGRFCLFTTGIGLRFLAAAQGIWPVPWIETWQHYNTPQSLARTEFVGFYGRDTNNEVYYGSETIYLNMSDEACVQLYDQLKGNLVRVTGKFWRQSGQVWCTPRKIQVIPKEKPREVYNFTNYESKKSKNF